MLLPQNYGWWRHEQRAAPCGHPYGYVRRAVCLPTVGAPYSNCLQGGLPSWNQCPGHSCFLLFGGSCLPHCRATMSTLPASWPWRSSLCQAAPPHQTTSTSTPMMSSWRIPSLQPGGLQVWVCCKAVPATRPSQLSSDSHNGLRLVPRCRQLTEGMACSQQFSALRSSRAASCDHSWPAAMRLTGGPAKIMAAL